MARHRLFVGQDPHKFSVAHMTVFPDGSKERLHGHNFNVSVALELANVSFEAFLDVGIMKKAIDAQCREWNEHLLLPEKNRALEILQREPELEFRLCGRRYVVPAEDAILLPVENVVVETLSMLFAEKFVARMGSALRRDVVEAVEVEVTEIRGQGGWYRWVWPAPAAPSPPRT